MTEDVSPKPSFPKRHLGDGVYVSHDGYHIILSLDGQDPNIRIALEPGLLQKIVEYEKEVIQAWRDWA